MHISLANDNLTTSMEYVKIQVNVESWKQWPRHGFVDEEVYDLLLGIPWMRRIGLNQSYDGGKVTVCGQNSLATGGFY